MSRCVLVVLLEKRDLKIREIGERQQNPNSEHPLTYLSPRLFDGIILLCFQIGVFKKKKLGTAIHQDHEFLELSVIKPEI
jgi:hypothetical protein